MLFFHLTAKSNFAPAFTAWTGTFFYLHHHDRSEEKKASPGFYLEAFKLFQEAGWILCWGGMVRDTKDLDIFCLRADYPKILKYFAKNGLVTELTDVRWLAKVFKGNFSWMLIQFCQ